MTNPLAKEQLLQRFWRCSVVGDRNRVDVAEAVHDVRVLQRVFQRGRQFLNDGCWRVLWCEDAVPDIDLEAFETGLICCRDVRQRRQTRLGGHGISLYQFAFDWLSFGDPACLRPASSKRTASYRCVLGDRASASARSTSADRWPIGANRFKRRCNFIPSLALGRRARRRITAVDAGTGRSRR